MHTPSELERQVDTVLRLLDGRRLSRESPVYAKALEWITHYPGEVDIRKKALLIQRVCTAFQITEPEIYAGITGTELQGSNGSPSNIQLLRSEEDKLEACLPQGGWFEWYTEYTRRTESPLSYHIFSSMAVLGAALGRRVYKAQGFFNIFPNYCVILIGPPGRVRKTSAVNVANSFVTKAALCPVLADKITPERIVSSLKESGHHWIHAPEFSVFFGRQKYMEGMATQMLRLLDCPDNFKIATMTREEEVTGVALTILGASTLSLLAHSTPTETTSSGFLSRFILVVESDTSREYPEPQKGSPILEAKLMATLVRLKAYEGEMVFTPEAAEWYAGWYSKFKQKLRNVDEHTAEVLERQSDQLIRTAMLIHLPQHDNMKICAACCQTADKLLTHVERQVPRTVSAIEQSANSQDVEFVLETLRRLGGAADHSKLLRRVSNRIDSGRFRRCIETLADSGRLKIARKGAAHCYAIIEEE